MQELLHYLYQPSTLLSSMLNVSVCAILLLVVIGFIASRRKVSKQFFFGWLSSILLCSSALAYSTYTMHNEMNADSLRQVVEISRQGNLLVVTSKSHIVKNTTIEIEDESDKNLYVKIEDRLVKIDKSDL